MRTHRLLVASLACVLMGSSAFAIDTTTGPAKVPPSGDAATAALTASPRHGEWVDVAVPNSDVKLKCFVSYPERKDKAPVVIVIHEIFGMTDWVRGVNDQLAAEGFIAIAPDLLSGKGPNGGATDSFKADDVRRAIGQLSPEEVMTRLNAAKDYATALPSATPKFATIGFCWGGTQSFAYATKQPDLGAAVIYYGTAPTDKAQLEKIHADVFGFYGGDDNRVTSTVQPTTDAMKSAGKAYTPHVYEGAGHGFLRQQDGRNGANAKAAAAAWADTLAFLKEKLEAK
ncbi:MAG: dienelactone hydrolase family protein [Tepidisphaeraceae bacterium]